MVDIMDAPEPFLRENLANYLRKKLLRVDGREIRVKIVEGIDDIGMNELPLVGIGKCQIPSRRGVTHETVEFDGILTLFFAVRKGTRELESDQAMSRLVHSVFNVINQSRGFTLESYGVFSHCSELREIESFYDASDNSGFARQYSLNFSGSYPTET
jgi:hypothetical protein